MSGTIDRLAAKLADDVMAAMEETGEDRLYVEVGNVLAASSQTLEEAFLTEIRVRLSEVKARQFLKTRLSQHRAAARTPNAT